MTRDEIINLAISAGFHFFDAGHAPMLHMAKANYSEEYFERFAALIAAAEREACAVICDELESFWNAEKDVALLNGDVDLSNASSGEPRAARAIAAAIRARGNR